ncbi:retrovirus-related pol polyprotein from transposon TNT 1-94 [Tanacetum coccineum]
MRSHVNDFQNVVTIRTKVTGQNNGSWGFEHIREAFDKDVKPFVKTLKEYFHMFDQGLYKEITDMKVVFTQMETKVAKCFVERKTFEIKDKELIIENDRLLEHIICQDVMSVVMHADVESKNVLPANNNSLEHDNLEAELLKKENDRLIELIISQDLVHTHMNTLATVANHRNMEKMEHARALKPLDSDLDSAYKFATRVQELLVYVKDTCPSSSKQSEKLIAVTPIKKTKKLGMKSSTSSSRSQPSGNTKKDRISQTTSSNKKNKVEGHLRSVKSSLNKKNRVSEPVCNANVVQIILWYLDSGCSKHMTRQYSQLINFVSKFMGTVRFGNDHVVAIRGYRDYHIGNVMISRVYYVEGLGYNLLLVGQFCDSDLEVAFRKHTCYVCDLEGVDLLKVYRGSSLYTLLLEEMMQSSLICLLSKASKTKYWLWHRRLSHLNFGYINKLSKQGLVQRLPKLKYQKDHLCSACSLGKSKKYTYKPKSDDSIQEKLYLL